MLAFDPQPAQEDDIKSGADCAPYLPPRRFVMFSRQEPTMTLIYAIATMLFVSGFLIGVAIGFTGGRKTVQQ